MTYGGYSSDMVVYEHFVLRIPDNLDLAASAPLLCAGITMYSPMKKWKMDVPGTKIAVMGLGGLGHMAVKFGAAFGCEVTVITHTKSKEALAKKLGAKKVLLADDEAGFQEHQEYFKYILDTTSLSGNYSKYMSLLKVDGSLVKVGATTISDPPVELSPFDMLRKRRQFAGSLIGGIKQTQEMLDFCGKHNIVCEIEKIKMQQVNEAFTRVQKSDVLFRFVIDCESLKQ